MTAKKLSPRKSKKQSPSSTPATINRLSSAAVSKRLKRTASSSIADMIHPSSPADADVLPVEPSDNGDTPLASLLSKSIKMVKGQFKHKPTDEQQAILDAAAAMNGKGCLVIEAGAGTGKTETLTMLEQVLPGIGQYTAFNNPLVASSRKKFKKCQCNTTHSLAFRAVGKLFAHRLDSPRVRSYEVAKVLGIEDFPVLVDVGNEQLSKRMLDKGLLAALVLGAVRRFCQSADSQITGGHLKYLDGIDFPKDGQRTYANNALVREYLAPFLDKAWADLSNPKGTLPYNADCYVKVWQLDNPVISANYILLDEDQDTAPVMADVLSQQDAMLILVGDSAQEIYEWRGAMNATKLFPNAKRLYLTQSFRFGPAIADLANRVLDQLDEQTPLRLKGLPSINSKIEALDSPDAILCRTNGAAVKHLIDALAEGRKPFLVGGTSDVVRFVEAAEALQQGRATSHPELACFGSWLEVQEYVKGEEGEDLKLMVRLIDGFGAHNILTALRTMSSEEQADLVISTAHKSKGREWERVKLAADFPTLTKSSDSDLKLLYVSVTRAKLSLDVSECPFFTGQDALPFDVPEQRDGSVLPVAPSTPPPPTAFTWSKGKDGRWLVRGPVIQEGITVTVTRKDGSGQSKRLNRKVWSDNGVALYEV